MKTRIVNTRRDCVAEVTANVKFMKSLQRPSCTVSILDLEALLKLAQLGELHSKAFREREKV
jgi:hypothetical protein